MPGERAASLSFAEFARHERQDRVEPELGPRTALLTADPTATSASAEISSMVSEIDTEPRLFDAVPRETQLVSAPSRAVPVEKLFTSVARSISCCSVSSLPQSSAFSLASPFSCWHSPKKTKPLSRPAQHFPLSRKR